MARSGWGGVALVLLLAGAAAGGAPDPTIQLTEYGFVLDRIDVGVGQKVVFKNTTRKEHTVVIPRKRGGELKQDKAPAEFDSGVLRPRRSWEYVCSKEGMYNYYCKEDRTMTGVIVVSAGR